MDRYFRQLPAPLQHHAHHVLQHQQRVQPGVEERLQLLAVHAGAHAAHDEPRGGAGSPEIHQSLLSL